MNLSLAEKYRVNVHDYVRLLQSNYPSASSSFAILHSMSLSWYLAKAFPSKYTPYFYEAVPEVGSRSSAKEWRELLESGQFAARIGVKSIKTSSIAPGLGCSRFELWILRSVAVAT